MGTPFRNTFGDGKILLGMIHLAGSSEVEHLERAIDEVRLYETAGLDGAIVEDYHGNIDDVKDVLEVLSVMKTKIQIGVNVLSNPYLSFELAKKYGASFVQFDTIQTSPGEGKKRFDEEIYKSLRRDHQDICVLGGVRFKYIPSTGRTLEKDIADGMGKCEVIVTTGDGTGIETPLEKLKNFRTVMVYDVPLIVGAGVNYENVIEQLEIADGAIIGSYFKNGQTHDPVQENLVKSLVDKVNTKFK